MATKMTIREGVILLAAVVSIFCNINQYFATNNARADADEFKAALKLKQEELNKSETERAALENMSVPGFLRKYDAHIAELKTFTVAYDKAKAAKGANIIVSSYASDLAHSEKDLNAATDSFTDFINRWRPIAAVLDQMLDGNVKQLEAFRRENNIIDVHDMVSRIIRSARDLASALRVAVDAARTADH